MSQTIGMKCAVGMRVMLGFHSFAYCMSHEAQVTSLQTEHNILQRHSDEETQQPGMTSYSDLFREVSLHPLHNNKHLVETLPLFL